MAVKHAKQGRSTSRPSSVGGAAHVVRLKSGGTYEANHVYAHTYLVHTTAGHQIEVPAEQIEAIDDFDIIHETEHTAADVKKPPSKG